MPKIYISTNTLTDTINYFAINSYKSPEQIGLYLFFKSIGLTEKEYVSFPKVSKMSQSEKDYYNKNLHYLSGLFTEQENGKHRTCLFPFSISNPVKKGDFFNGRTLFKDLLSRLTDTMDNTLIDKFLDKNENDEFKLKRGSNKYVKENLLAGNKISFTYLSAWVSRFTEFDVESLSEFTNIEFTRVCTKHTKDFLKLSEIDKQELFIDDSHATTLSYNSSPILGTDLRGLFNFVEAPDVEAITNTVNLNKITVAQKEVSKYMELNDNNPTSQEIEELLNLRKQIILYGVPGIGKTKFISDIENKYKNENIVKIQFHPSTTYEDFIGGETIKDGEVVTRAGIFLEACKKAETSSENFLFVIDEINRGNISKILGETIQALDREYEIDLIRPLITATNEKIEKISIPDNMHIIATMNSADRSIAILDLAIRRRFDFVKLQPNYEVVGSMSDNSNIDVNVEDLFKTLNRHILETLNNEDLLLGQSYFLPKFASRVNNKIKWEMSDLRFIFNYSIIPTLEEYTYGNKNDLLKIIGEKMLNRINNNQDFSEALIEQFPECKK